MSKFIDTMKGLFTGTTTFSKIHIAISVGIIALVVLVVVLG